jgi:hypothetical protein
MKQGNVKYSKKFKQWSDEAFNAGKKSEAMKRLTLHRIASSLHRFIASSAQLCTVLGQSDLSQNAFGGGGGIRPVH